jgi:hypothetical protein
MYSNGLERRDDERETVVVGDGEACSIDDDDKLDVLLSNCDDDDVNSFASNKGSNRSESKTSICTT